MPAHDTSACTGHPETQAALHRMFDPERSLAEEVAMLRHEVRMLREDLTPPAPSIIATGPEVIEAFRRLSKG